MEELVRDLLAFQDTFSANGVVTPMPPPVSTFEQPVSIPVPDVDVDPAVGAGSNVPESESGVVPPTNSTTNDSGIATVTEIEGGMDTTNQLPDPGPADSTSELDLGSNEPTLAINSTSVSGSENGIKRGTSADSGLGTQQEMDILLEQIPDEMSLDVYREGAVDQVITQPEEKMVLDDPASASASNPDPNADQSTSASIPQDKNEDEKDQKLENGGMELDSKF
jgi:hypothetical protein